MNNLEADTIDGDNLIFIGKLYLLDQGAPG